MCREELSFRRLDVGCGANPTGDVNVDLYVGFSPHTGDQLDPATFQKINPSEISNFVRAEGCHLPFRHDAFEEVYSSHLIEHIRSPLGFLRELVRVTKPMGTLHVRCPHRFARARREMPCHVSKLDEQWFATAARKLGLRILSLMVTWIPIGFRVGFFHIRPFAKAWELDVKMRKIPLVTDLSYDAGMSCPLVLAAESSVTFLQPRSH